MLNNACGGGAGGVNVGLLPTLEGETPLTTFHFLAGHCATITAAATRRKVVGKIPVVLGTRT